MNITEAIISLKKHPGFPVFLEELKTRRENAMKHLVEAGTETFPMFQGAYKAMDSLIYAIESAEELAKLVADNAPKRGARADS